MAAGHALEKACHRLISTANLDLEEGSLFTITSISRALSRTLLRIVPGAGTTKDIFPLDTLVQSSRKDRLGNVVFERAGTALESVGPRACEGDGEDVCAMGADWRLALISSEREYRIGVGESYIATWRRFDMCA